MEADMVDVKISVVDAGDLKRLVRDLRDVEDGKELRKELTGGLRQVANPIRDEVKAAYRAMPAGRGRRRAASLGSQLARVTRTEVRTSGRLAGVRVRVDGRKMPDRAKSLPAYVEGYKRPWRHPVFGDRDVWVSQPARPRFDRIVGGHEDDARRAIERVVDGVRAKLEGGR